MNSIPIPQSAELVSGRFRERLIDGLKVKFVIQPLQRIFKSEMEAHEQMLQKCEKGTVGYELRKMLKTHRYRVIPKFENHDLKHVILGYGMSTTDEICMQMYLVGNGNFSPVTLLFAASGILFPSEWQNFFLNYKKGKRARSIFALSILDCMHQNAQSLKKHYREAANKQLSTHALG